MIEIAHKITVDEKVKFGKPVVKGTRVSVDLVLDKLAGGMEMEEIIKEYQISKEDILAVLHYAAQVLGREGIRVTG
ncbi:MAG: DUF433 domain-containing protein [Spirochaetes bacterium]|nr:DUF433 domain-containing protein [Spirochaetota bacterium]